MQASPWYMRPMHPTQASMQANPTESLQVNALGELGAAGMRGAARTAWESVHMKRKQQVKPGALLPSLDLTSLAFKTV